MDSPSNLPTVIIRNPYNYDPDEASRQSGLYCNDPSLTSQEFADEANINYMLEKYGVTGEISVMAKEALQGDFSGIGDYRSMLDQLKAAQGAFDDLPAPVRRYFNDDPAAFLAFVDQPGAQDQLKEWGLLDLPPEDSKVKTDQLIQALDRLTAATTKDIPA